MPYRKIKQESYNSLGGINNKVSQYLNSPVEFLNISNFDFQIPGSLSLRWGSTYYVGQTLPGGKITGLNEYVKASGASYVVVTGNTFAYTVTGTSLTSFFGLVQHASFFNYAGHINATLYGFTPPFSHVLGASLNYDFQIMNDWLFACDGRDFWKFNGQTAYFFGMGAPYAFSGASGFDDATSGLFENSGAIQTNPSGGLSPGTFYYKAGFVNNRGAVGPATTFCMPNIAATVIAPGSSQAIPFSINAGVWSKINPGFGISYVQMYVHWEPPTSTLTVHEAYNQDFYPITDISGSIFRMVPGTTYILQNNTQIGLTLLEYNLPFGVWYKSDNFFGSNDESRGTSIVYSPAYIPQFIENYATSLFSAGFSALPSTLYYSDTAEPEQIQLDSFIDIRTDDGQAISGLKNFSGGLVIFKENSFHALTGDSSENFNVREISKQYGCLNNRAIAQFQDVLIFLDRKGIVQFNGSNIDLLSSKIDPILKRMNITAAKETACMSYDKLRNEVLCDIPVDGSNSNNITLVYDIIQKAWTTYEYGHYTPAVTQVIRGRLDNYYAVMGGYSGEIAYFGPSFINDAGVGITYSFESRFHTEEGNSITKQYRRLFINVNPAGSTVALDIEFFKDFNPISVLSRTMYQDPFQSRIDFGIPGKSLAFSLAGISTTDKMVFHGYTLEHRFQRAV